MKYDYYLHHSGGRAFDYFGGIGDPFRVSFIRAFIWKLLGFRMTKVRKGANLISIMTRATLKAGAHRHSVKIQEIRGNK
jgi:hypothetical protein